ncbi:serine--tRNA ligase [Lyticum sinuosum]|uniref:Serine--tRNA ligase n=1 Tax=Lyticum sinuosum TaxID=1332059 RepID=A0AAE4VLE7_9RICK|nr:serine--tRNA ligase [Lyticum sinuosum]MDZ5761392.1 Serine--tRNA ligase [Lyticum sinuosum]
MYKVSLIRSDQESFDRGMRARGISTTASDIILIDNEVCILKNELQNFQTRRNSIAKEISIAKIQGNNNLIQELMIESECINKQISTIKYDLTSKQEHLDNILSILPNIPDECVPIGGEDDSILFKEYGEKKVFNFIPKQHFDLGEDLTVKFNKKIENNKFSISLMDFKTAIEISGTRFVLLYAELAQLERALAQYMLDNAEASGYIEISTPLMVLDKVMYNVGQLPKFSEDSFVVDKKYRLIPTSEAVLTNIVANKTLDISDLPLRFTAYTPCFRSEAGSAGKDTKGMIRMHQFNKVELVSITSKNQSNIEHEYMLNTAENVLRGLDLPYRIIVLASKDMGFASRKTYDIEVWLPGCDKYREISSCSNCGEFQAVRMKSYYIDQDKKKNYIHTLNGSGLAVGRTLIAVLENYQQEDGSIAIPDILKKYMKGMDKIQNRSNLK